jgi:ornithine cyclodeaminase/alanine dehydrogenase-like protein (mu-crystallin family)
MTAVPVFTGKHVEQAVSPDRAVEAVRQAFIAHARGEWTMPPKIYVTNYPAGDFRAMPALGAGHALLKWVTSFPGNPLQGLPTVTGVVLVSDAENGQLRAVLDAASVTALRTGAAAVLAAETLGRADSVTATVIGAGVNGRAAARTFLARGRPVGVWDVNEGRAKHVAQELGAQLAPSLEEALAADLLVTVTPGHEIVIGEGTLRPGQHVSLMGADGPGKAELAGPVLARARLVGNDQEQAGTAVPERRVRLYIDEWEQASHSGEIAQVVASGQIAREDVTQLGDVLAGAASGREADTDITLFDSTGLAIQDLAIALVAIENASELVDLPTLDL